MSSLTDNEIASDCVWTNLRGNKFFEFSCLYPAWGATLTPFEKSFEPVIGHDYLIEHPVIPIVACVLYGLMIGVGRAYFRHRDAWNWRRTMIAWNLGLSLFSAIGFSRTLPHLLHNLFHFTLEQNLCNDPEYMYGSGSTGLWVQLFVLSKFPELFDTFFIVIHKKKLIFLHWYHHVTVLLYCWHSYVTKTPSGLFFCVMNYGVHSIMYMYYFLMAIKIRWPAMVVTGLQISQMVVGVVLTVLSFVYAGREGCWISQDNNTAAFLMYGSYLMLFLQFFIGRYLFSRNKKPKKL